jgi:hypothetical protein
MHLYLAWEKGKAEGVFVKSVKNVKRVKTGRWRETGAELFYWFKFEAWTILTV